MMMECEMVNVIRKKVLQDGNVTTVQYPDAPPMRTLNEFIQFENWVNEHVQKGDLELEIISLTPERET